MGSLPEEVERGLSLIASDTTNGAAELHRRALALASRLPPEFLPLYGEELLRGRRDMAPLVNLALALSRSKNPAEELTRLVSRAERAAEVIAAKAREVIAPGRRLVTISRSSTVLAVLTALEPGLVLALESLPGGEGRRLVEELGESGVPAELVPDEDLVTAVERAELGLCGADAVTERLFVNKVGTRALAERLRERGGPLFVAADRTKFMPGGYYTPPAPGGLFEEIPLPLVERVLDDDDDWHGPR